MPWLLILVAVVTCSCGKDLDVAGLTTNPFDPDYTGPDLVVKVSDSTWYANGQEHFQLRYRVRKELFPQRTAYSIKVTRLDDGTQSVSASLPYGSLNVFTSQWPDAVIGTSYCVDVSVGTENSYARTYRICGTAGN
ncbi:MAG: hypothetical protein QM724_10850 [Flavobacteriales bacterium]